MKSNQFITPKCILCLAVSSQILLSCVKQEYDVLNKDIDGTVQLGTNGADIPVGTTVLSLTNLINPEDIEGLDLVDGLYVFSMNDNFSERVSLEPIELDDINADVDPLDVSIGELDGLMNIPSETIPVNSLVVDAELVNLDINPIDITEIISLKDLSDNRFIGNNNSITLNNINLALSNQVNSQLRFDPKLTLPKEIAGFYNIEFKDNSVLELSLDVSGAIGQVENCVISAGKITVTFPNGFNIGGGLPFVNKASFTPTSNSGGVVKYNIPVHSYDYGDDYVSSLAFNKSIKIEFDDIPTISGRLTANSQGMISYDFSSKIKIAGSIEIKDAKIRMNEINYLIDEMNISEIYEINDIPSAITSINNITFGANSKMSILVSPIDLCGLTLSSNSISLNIDDRLSLSSGGKPISSISIPGSSLTTVSGYSKEFNIEALDLKGLAINDGRLDFPLKASIGGKFTFESHDVMLSQYEKMTAKNINPRIIFSDLEVDKIDVEKIALTIPSEEISINVPESGILEVPKEIKKVKIIEFKNGTSPVISLNLHVDGIDPNIGEIKLEDFSITLPEFLKLSENQDNRIVVDGQELTVNGVFEKESGNTRSFKLDILFDQLNFTDPKYADIISDGKLSIVDKLIFNSAKVTIAQSDVELDKLGDLSFTPEISITDLEIGKVYGEVALDSVFEEIDNQQIDLSALTDVLGNNASLELDDPQVAISLNNPLDIGLNLKVNLIPIVSGVEKTPIVLETEITSGENNIVFNKNNVSNLSSLFNPIPEKALIKLEGEALAVSENNWHCVDLSQPDIDFDVAYDIRLPLAFKTIDVTIEQSVSDLAEVFESIAESVDNLGLTLQCKNSIELDLNFEEIIPLNAAGESIAAKFYPIIKGELSKLAAAVDGKPSTSEIKLLLKEKTKGALSELDGFNFIVKIGNSQASSLNSSQTLEISISAFVEDGVELELF